jgi:hypothetical protein
MQRNSAKPELPARRVARVPILVRLLAFLAAFLAALISAPASAAWRPPTGAAWRAPVGGAVSRGFSMGANPYAGGQHRGADFVAPPGAVVRAPCAGRIVVAGRVGASGGVVTVLCGEWRVTVLPLATTSARRGQSVSARTRLGTLAPSPDHAGVHLGVRRDGTRFGYVDPLRFLAPSRPPAAPPLGRAPRAPRLSPPRAVPARPLDGPAHPLAGPKARPLDSVSLPHRLATPSWRARAARKALAPWPAWVGLALALGGLGGGFHARRRRGHRLGAAVVRGSVAP